MIFDVTKSSDWNYREQIQINTLDELLDFIKTNGQIVLIPPTPNFVHYGHTLKLPCIEIYDSWRE